MLEAKCPQCGKRAEVNNDMSKVECRHCGFSASYDDYIEIMKGRQWTSLTTFR
jgi:ribosomal protein L37E